MRAAGMSRVSVRICTRNRPAELLEVLASIRQSEVSIDEVVSDDSIRGEILGRGAQLYDPGQSRPRSGADRGTCRPKASPRMPRSARPRRRGIRMALGLRKRVENAAGDLGRRQMREDMLTTRMPKMRSERPVRSQPRQVAGKFPVVT
jgi:hypothetical protein